jgi:hypothetical protein
MGSGIVEYLDSLIGKKCAFETRESTIRTEVVTGIEKLTIQIGDHDNIFFPKTVFFSPGESDGIEVAAIKKIRIMEEG